MTEQCYRTLQEYQRKKKKSKGRQKVPKPIRYGENFVIVSPITKEHFLIMQENDQE